MEPWLSGDVGEGALNDSQELRAGIWAGHCGTVDVERAVPGYSTVPIAQQRESETPTGVSYPSFGAGC